VRRLAFISLEKGLDSFSQWLQERTVRHTREVYENVEQMAFINCDGSGTRESVLENLVSDDSVLSKAFGNRTEAGEEIPSVVYVRFEEDVGLLNFLNNSEIKTPDQVRSRLGFSANREEAGE
jgi:hypothetical protein